MRVSRVQAEANRERVIDVASQLFREHGYDGIGLKDLMAAAGLTPGGFYKQFASKEDLAAQATARAIEKVADHWSEVFEANAASPLDALVAFYLSAAHRDAGGRGCPLAALGSDAARQPPAIRAEFDAGIRRYLGLIGSSLGNGEGLDDGEGQAPTAQAMTILSTLVGALILSRMTNDAGLSDSFLAAATNALGEITAAPGGSGLREG